MNDKPDYDEEGRPVGISFRVYGLEQVVGTQDDAITRQGLSLAQLDERVQENRAMLAVHTEQIRQVVVSATQLNETMNKVMWTLIGFAFTIAASAVSLAVAFA